MCNSSESMIYSIAKSLDDYYLFLKTACMVNGRDQWPSSPVPVHLNLKLSNKEIEREREREMSNSMRLVQTWTQYWGPTQHCITTTQVHAMHCSLTSVWIWDGHPKDKCIFSVHAPYLPSEAIGQVRLNGGIAQQMFVPWLLHAAGELSHEVLAYHKWVIRATRVYDLLHSQKSSCRKRERRERTREMSNSIIKTGADWDTQMQCTVLWFLSVAFSTCIAHKEQ